MSSHYHGQCACGSIKYSCDAEPAFTLICQCRQCQLITGTGHAVQFAIAADKTTIQGQVSIYRLTSDSGNEVESAFCGNCGSPVYKTTSGMPDKLVFHAATLNDPSIFSPQMLVYHSSAQPWDAIDPAIKRAGN